MTTTTNNARPWELRTWASERKCPACGDAVALFAAERDGYRIDACGSCGGSWLAIEATQRMIDTANKTPIDLARMSDNALATKAAAPAESAERTCPDCKAKLVREPMGNVEIDVCDQHGTWFDRQELEHVATLLIHNYGPAARQKAADAEAAANYKEPLVDPRNVAAGVVAVGFALIGLSLGSTAHTEIDFMGRKIEVDGLGNRIDAVTRLPIKK